ncbi:MULTISPECIES: hypothetical protein [unclassified Massilia]|uniref:hypothetical protein n=1 Tax=unclassified Massilia TaxID=2609279 RepID=UPI001786F7E9|nr:MULTISPECIES: hypothetical protein [unclassified Massilia]MBD8530123.1 hypothetical protein [Massilia sp. CFBP 13647]MBD8674048.1 hypothetical protein [Massilia sp. CFBP 13721]
MYRLELSAGVDPVSTDTVVDSVIEAQALAMQLLKPDSVLIVTKMKHGVDHGEFLIFLNRMELAYVRLLEHQGFHAARSQTAAGKTVRFVADGCPFEVDENATIPRDVAMEALSYWLSTGQKLTGLYWGVE